MLLRASRASLMETAELAGANALVDEEYVPFIPHLDLTIDILLSRWTYTICGPKHRANGTFRVHVGLGFPDPIYTTQYFVV